VQARRPRFPQDEAAAQRVAARFLLAARTGDLQGLMDVLAPDVVLLNDGGGKIQAARRPVVTADKVARLLVGLRAGLGELTYSPAVVNGRPGGFIYLDGALDSVVTVEIEGDRVSGIYLVRNPDKLGAIGNTQVLGR
jgi:RNA polymerase sigma-70 factor (ECF subfamily)